MIRILRLIEYTYEDEARAANDQLHWTLTKTVPGFTMKSAVLPFESIPWVNETHD